jgi:hypothetical protein
MVLEPVPKAEVLEQPQLTGSSKTAANQPDGENGLMV